MMHQVWYFSSLLDENGEVREQDGDRVEIKSGSMMGCDSSPSRKKDCRNKGVNEQVILGDSIYMCFYANKLFMLMKYLSKD